MNNTNNHNIKADCQHLYNAFKGRLSWKWDSRFDSALAVFPVKEKDWIYTILEIHLSHTWNKSTISKAPDVVQVINSTLGGLKKGQLLFTSDPEKDSFLYCAWWPWDDGTTISIRIAPSSKYLHEAYMLNTELLIKEWFEIKEIISV